MYEGVLPEICIFSNNIEISDGSGIGLRPKPARLRGFLGGPSPPEARSSKPESPKARRAFSGLKLANFGADLGLNFGKIVVKKF